MLLIPAASIVRPAEVQLIAALAAQIDRDEDRKAFLAEHRRKR